MSRWLAVNGFCSKQTETSQCSHMYGGNAHIFVFRIQNQKEAFETPPRLHIALVKTKAQLKKINCPANTKFIGIYHARQLTHKTSFLDWWRVNELPIARLSLEHARTVTHRSEAGGFMALSGYQ